jgi:putative copper export protein
MNTSPWEQPDRKSAFAQGRRHGLAIAALLVSLVSFVSLLGAEKAIAAVALAAVAMKGAEAGSLPRKLGIAAIVVSTLFLMTAAVVLIAFWDKAVELVRLLEQLS